MKKQHVRDTDGKQGLCINTISRAEMGLYISETFPVLGQSSDCIMNCACYDDFILLECKY